MRFMHVVITGASAGIGRALASEFKKGGARLTLVARRRPLLEEVAAAVGGAHIAEQDLADSESAAAFLPEAEEKNGPVDVLINNAGMQIVERFATLDPARAELEMRLNLFTPLRLAHAVLPSMRERGGGTIVNVASVAAFAPLAGQVHYVASKAALAHASEAMRVELKREGVHVLTVYPGYIHTEMGDTAFERYKHPLAKLYRAGKPEGLARKVRAAVEKRRARVIYPAYNRVPVAFGGTTRAVLEHFGPSID